MTRALRFYIGLHRPNHAQHFQRVCLSINTVRDRRSPVIIGAPDGGSALLDSGAFTEIVTHGRYRHDVAEYARAIRRIAKLICLDAAVAQDWMCEPFIVARTGLSVAEHQRLTVDRYHRLVAEGVPVYVLPVLQGFEPADYVRHIALYGDDLDHGSWVGVGSVCKRNARPNEVARVLQAIKDVRPDLRLHGFGVKLTALRHPAVRSLLYSADSMAWSFAARRQGRDQNDWREAKAFLQKINAPTADRQWQGEFAL